MKKKIVLFMLLLGATSMLADDFAYLQFSKSDGSTQSFPVQGLTITFANGQAVVNSGTSTANLSLPELTMMQFSNTSTGISNVTDDATGGKASAASVEVYSVTGSLLGVYKDEPSLRAHLPIGVYILKSGATTKKIIVR